MRTAVIWLSFLTLVNAGAQVSFEVASVKPNNTGFQAPTKFEAEHGRLTAINVPVGALILYAYSVKAYQITGGPDRMIDRYDVVAKAENTAGRDELMGMLQSLLKERFKLQLDRETLQIQGYVISVEKAGPGLKESKEGEPFRLRSMPLDGQAVSMTQLASFLTSMLHGPVEDQTGLHGLYDFKADWRPDPQFGSGPGFYVPLRDAMRTELGLKLDAGKVPVEVLIVKHLERPTEN